MLTLLSRCATHIIFSTSKTPPHHTTGKNKLEAKMSNLHKKKKGLYFGFYARESLDF